MTALTDLDQELRRIGSDYSGTWRYALAPNLVLPYAFRWKSGCGS